MIMFKSQLICCFIVFFIGLFYFVSARERNKTHNWYSALLIVSFFQLVFDVLSVITVNHLDTIPAWINHVVHIFFMGLLLTIFFAVYKYLESVIEYELKDLFKKNKFIYALFIISIACMILLPIEYTETPYGNYASGLSPISIYISIAIYIVLIIRLLILYGAKISKRKIKAIVVAILSEVIISGLQLIFPTLLISSLGVTLLNLSFYLMVENPDATLVELLKKERARADEANHAKTDFLASMSHEIRTPINAMVGMTEMILRERDIHKAKEYARDVKDANYALLKLINDILDITKIESGKLTIDPVEYSFKKMIHEVVSMLESRMDEKGLDFLVDVDENIPSRLWGDDVHVKQILINLLGNAFKYTKRGRVILRVELLPESARDYVCLRFSVEDTGIGIKEEDLARIMVPYERVELNRNRNIEGSGLGMPITRQLLAAMGSTLSVESEYRKGSTFSFVLSQGIRDASPVGDILSMEQEQMVTSNYLPMFTAPDAKILVVDDNAMNRKVFRILLADTKIQIEEASSGILCLEMVKTKPYDIIFMDHMMPEMDGIETYSIMKRMKYYPNEHTPVVVVTANAIKGARDRYIVKEGFRAYLSKPIEYIELEKLIKNLLPKNLVHQTDVIEEQRETKEEMLPMINGVDWGYAGNHFRNQKDMLQMVQCFYDGIEKELDELHRLYADLKAEDGYKNYCTKIHSMKNSAAIVGIVPLAGMAKVMEDAARNHKGDVIDAMMPIFTEKWLSYKTLFRDVTAMEIEKKRIMTEEEWTEFLAKVKKAAENLDILVLDELADDTKDVTVEEAHLDKYDKIIEAIAVFNVEYLLTI